MKAISNIEILNSYQVKKIITTCPHCFNTIKNEYPDLGGTYDVIHHSQLIDQLINDGKLKVKNDQFNGEKVKNLEEYSGLEGTAVFDYCAKIGVIGMTTES